ncbi:dihydrodipicolinate synthase family protein [Paenibacillus sp. JDR-2]|uniref:dihydrodipicolinate synthase family protein n=1 Tax=Paenibacillus sp. (strain JDR-2) TaxID=324057 RepID=UPI000166AB72|nr:dihydrodipicolinate synthase family protein [Paenibacillus sp. JDR-2]ACT04811.1 dihydrodipicolinate synthetase [Paenibacillus sp. JDR-2]
MSLQKFHGIIPAFYACYDNDGNISKDRTGQLASYLLAKKVQGVYVGGSSGECIYQSIEERKAVLAYAAESLKGKMTLIAHVGAPSTRDSIELAKHAAELGYDALSAIPPIYFKLPDSAVIRYWNDIMDATPLPFIIYNIPQTTGYQLTPAVFRELLASDKVIGVKNSSMPALDIERFKSVGGDRVIVFNGPDEQFVAGRMMGAQGGIGGTYAAMPELFLEANVLLQEGKLEEATRLQSAINDLIIALCSLNGSMYAGIKEVLRARGVDIGGVRAPLENLSGDDGEKIRQIVASIDKAIANFVR